VFVPNPEQAHVPKVEKLLFTVFKNIVSSGSAIPPGIHYLALVFKALPTARFNTK
jgi:hypothetical protein